MILNIGLLGFSDKRHIVYTLMRVLSGLGRTAFFTPNKQYLMLSEEHLSDFEINDIHVVVFNCDIEDLGEEYDIGSYEYIIYDIYDELPLKLDDAVLFDSHEFYAFNLEDLNIDDIPIFTACSVEKIDLLPQEKLIKIPPASFVEDTLQLMFQNRELIPIKKGKFLKEMTAIVSSITGLQSSYINQQLKKEVLKA